MKTHRGAAKRFKLTGTGKVMRRHAYRDHLLERSLRVVLAGSAQAEVTGEDGKRIKRLLGK